MTGIANPGTDRYSMAELMTVIITRSMGGEEEKWAAATSPLISMAAARLAQRTVTPNLWLFEGGSGVYNPDIDVVSSSPRDPRVSRLAESKVYIQDMVDRGCRGTNSRLEWSGAGFGGMQVDTYGNTNMIGIGPHPKLKVRGPETVGGI